MNIAYLEFRLSGGELNTSAASALGGIQSNTAVRGNTVSGTLAGVTFLDAPGCAAGSATLAFTAATGVATFAGPGASAGSGVTINANGRYVLADTLGQTLTIKVVAASLPVTNQAPTLTIAAINNGLFDDVGKSEAFYGDVEYRCLYLRNTHDTDAFYDIKLYLALDATGPDGLFIGVEGVPGDTAQTVGNENTAPSGVTFSNPTSHGTGVAISQINPGQAAPVWIKRVVPANTTEEAAADLAAIGVRAGY